MMVSQDSGLTGASGGRSLRRYPGSTLGVTRRSGRLSMYSHMYSTMALPCSRNSSVSMLGSARERVTCERRLSLNNDEDDIRRLVIQKQAQTQLAFRCIIIFKNPYNPRWVAGLNLQIRPYKCFWDHWAPLTIGVLSNKAKLIRTHSTLDPNKYSPLNEPHRKKRTAFQTE